MKVILNLLFCVMMNQNSYASQAGKRLLTWNQEKLTSRSDLKLLDFSNRY